MTDAQISSLAEAMASILVSHAAHGLATSALEGTGEITLRDGLIVAAAAAGAKAKQAWLLEREVRPNTWTEGAVDLMVSRQGNLGLQHLVGGVELKWWRKTDASNAANRRKDLIRDFVRAASIYPLVDSFSFVALLSTSVSWEATTDTTGTDKQVMHKLSDSGSQNWNVRQLAGSAGLKAALKSLNNKTPICSTFHTELLSSISLSNANGALAFAKVWRVKKPQNTIYLDAKEVQTFFAAVTKTATP